MKSLRFLLALALAGFLATAFVHAAEAKAKAEGKVCDCPKDKEGKGCGKDQDCCCAGRKCDMAMAKSDGKKAGKK